MVDHVHPTTSVILLGISPIEKGGFVFGVWPFCRISGLVTSTTVLVLMNTTSCTTWDGDEALYPDPDRYTSQLVLDFAHPNYGRFCRSCGVCCSDVVHTL